MRILLIVFTMAFASLLCKGQQFEPKWVGQVVLLNTENGDTIALPAEKANVQIKTSQSAGRILVGIGNVRRKVIIQGSKSTTQTHPERPVTLIVKCKDNLTDPSSFIQVIKFEETRKERRTELAKENWLGSTSEGNMKIIPFEADTYGTSSYILKLAPQSGEFGVIVHNPDVMDEKVPVFYCLGAHDTKPTSDTYELDGILYPVYQTKDGRSFIMKSKTEKYYIPEE